MDLQEISWRNRPLIKTRAPSPSTAYLASFTLCTFNVLAQALVRRSIYNHATKAALKWANRKKCLQLEFAALDADVFCLQEVDNFEAFWDPLLTDMGYTSLYLRDAKSGKQHGCILALKQSKIRLISHQFQFLDELAEDFEDELAKGELLRHNVSILAVVEVLGDETKDHKPLGPLVICTTHLYWNNAYPFTRFLQVQHIMRRARQLAEEYKRIPPTSSSSPVLPPIILAGDLNDPPGGNVMKILTHMHKPLSIKPGDLLTPRNHFSPYVSYVQETKEEEDYRKITEEEDERRRQQVVPILDNISTLPSFSSAYAEHPKHFPVDEYFTADPDLTGSFSAIDAPYTGYTPVNKCVGTNDYIMLEEAKKEHAFKLHTAGFAPIPSFSHVMAQGGIPDETHGSDHVPLMAEIALYH